MVVPVRPVLIMWGTGSDLYVFTGSQDGMQPLAGLTWDAIKPTEESGTSSGSKERA
jgi:hypothetical protein